MKLLQGLKPGPPLEAANGAVIVPILAERGARLARNITLPDETTPIKDSGTIEKLYITGHPEKYLIIPPGIILAGQTQSRMTTRLHIVAPGGKEEVEDREEEATGAIRTLIRRAMVEEEEEEAWGTPVDVRCVAETTPIVYRARLAPAHRAPLDMLAYSLGVRMNQLDLWSHIENRVGRRGTLDLAEALEEEIAESRAQMEKLAKKLEEYENLVGVAAITRGGHILIEVYADPREYQARLLRQTLAAALTARDKPRRTPCHTNPANCVESLLQAIEHAKLKTRKVDERAEILTGKARGLHVEAALIDGKLAYLYAVR